MEYKPDFTFGYEWALLELLTLSLSTPQNKEIFASIIASNSLNWQELLLQAQRHKLLHLLAFHVTSVEFASLITSQIKEKLQVKLFQNRQKTAIYRHEAARIVRAFQQNGISFVGTKGISLESTLYQGNGSRSFHDIDWMIAPSDRQVTSQVLAELGYQMGTFDPQTNSIIPHSRETLIGYRLNPDHLPSRVRLTQTPLIRFVEVDVANSLTWTLCPFQIPVEVALAEIIHQPIPGFDGLKLPCFKPQFQFLFTVLHLFKEAWIEITVEMVKDVNLSKFADVVRLWDAYQDVLQTAEFVNTLEDFGMVEPVVWVLEHLDRTFHTGIVAALELTGRVEENWLQSAGSVKGKMRYWRGTMRERLYCKNRQQLFVMEAFVE